MKSKSFLKRLIIAFLALLLAALILIFYNSFTEKRISDDISGVLSDPSYSEPVKLKDFPVFRQENSWSCGPDTIKMTAAYLNSTGGTNAVYDEELFSKRKSGMLPAAFEKYLKESLITYNAELSSNLPDSELLKILYSQLKGGLPVPVYFSTLNYFDKPNFDTHYSVVTGLDFQKKAVTIANAYGFFEEVSLEDFLGSLKYKNYVNEPFYFKLGVASGAIRRNNIYIISKK